MLAKSLACPVKLMFAYRNYFEKTEKVYFEVVPFSEKIDFDRKTRMEDLQNYAQRFASELEQRCADAPYQWFNFYPFWAEKTWVGLEYMGQTAALIAGYQLEQGMTEPHLGFLLGTRNYSVTTSGFEAGVILEVVCKEKAVVGDGLATFDCSIFIQGQDAAVAKAGLTVFRRKVEA